MKLKENKKKKYYELPKWGETKMQVNALDADKLES